MYDTFPIELKYLVLKYQQIRKTFKNCTLAQYIFLHTYNKYATV